MNLRFRLVSGRTNSCMHAPKRLIAPLVFIHTVLASLHCLLQEAEREELGQVGGLEVERDR